MAKQKGVACVTCQWLVKSCTVGKLLPTDVCLFNGSYDNNTNDKPDFDVQPALSILNKTDSQPTNNSHVGTTELSCLTCLLRILSRQHLLPSIVPFHPMGITVSHLNLQMNQPHPLLTKRQNWKHCIPHEMIFLDYKKSVKMLSQPRIIGRETKRLSRRERKDFK